MKIMQWRQGRAVAAARLTALALLLPAAAGAAKAPAQVPAELPAETLTVAPGPSSSERVYVNDLAIAHLPDTRVRVFDARSGKLLGMVSTGFVGNFTVSAKADEMYVVSTYHSRTWRGERVDVLEVHDTASLAFKYEIVLPTKRAQALNYRGLVRPTANGRFVLVQNATPATSVTVVDLQQRKVAGEIPAPGCYLVYPAASHASRFSMLCGDGKIATVTLDEQGQVSERQVSDKLFDADADAWFQHAEQLGDRYWFLSFKGVLTEVDLGGAVAVVKSTRPLVDAAGQRAGWRPGGYQAFAVDASARWLVAAMHDKGNEGSHKRPAKKLWIVDLASGKRVAAAPGHNITALTFSRSGQRLHALDGETGAMHIWQVGARGALKPVVTVKRAGDTVMHLESHD
jgi:methylamine dehydrogenase heavy chain